MALQIKNTLGGGKPEGLYAWKKYEDSFVEKNFASVTTDTKSYYTETPTNETITYYYSTSYTFDKETGLYTLVNPSERTQAYGASYVSFNADNYVMPKSPTGNRMWKSNSSEGARAYNNSSGVYFFYYYTEHYSEEGAGNFIDYIVSDKETAYPDGGEKGGYWYERVAEGLTPEMLGFTKYEVGSFTLSSNNATITFNHTLGEKPKAVIVNEDSSITDLKYVNTFLTTGVYSAYSYNKRAAEYGTYTNTSNNTTVEITTGNTTRNFKAGVKYNYVVFA